MNECNEVLLTDAVIVRFELQKLERSLTIVFEDGYHANDEKYIDGRIVVRWESIGVKFYNNETEEWNTAKVLSLYELASVCEIEWTSKETLEIRGFARELYWWSVWSFSQATCRLIR